MADTAHPWLDKLGGRFIVFDGPDGSGKTTQLRRLIAHLESAGLPLCHVREPGGTNIGEQIRRVLLDPAHDQMQVRCEMLLYMASRAQLIHERIGPALRDRHIVLADRFISSTLAYQGTAGGLCADQIMQVGRVALGDCWPDLVLIFDVDPQTAARRLAGSAKRSKYVEHAQPSLFADRVELKGSDFQSRVRAGYLEQAENDPDHYALINAAGDEQTVFDRMFDCLQQRAARW